VARGPRRGGRAHRRRAARGAGRQHRARGRVRGRAGGRGSRRKAVKPTSTAGRGGEPARAAAQGPCPRDGADSAL